MDIGVIWEAVTGTAFLLTGALMTVSPSQFLKVRNAIPGLRFALRPRQEVDDSEHMKKWRNWKLRTRILGGFFVVIGVLLLHADSRSELPQPSPIFTPES